MIPGTIGAFESVHFMGAVLPAEALARAADLRMPGQGAADYQLTPGMTVNAAVARAWEASLGAYRHWRAALQRRPDGDPAVAITRSGWLLPLLYELGYGRPETLTGGIEAPPGIGELAPVRFRVSHQLSWPDDAAQPEVGMPLHLVGAGFGLDERMPGSHVTTPHATVQSFLNRHPAYLWGIVSNGHVFRVLRDASSLLRRAHVEFDLDDIFDNQRYADFRLFFLTTHASRFAPIAAPSATPRPHQDTDDSPELRPLAPESCWLERWRTAAISDGTRALGALRLSVARAMQHLGTGFVEHPANGHLRERLAATHEATHDLHRGLLRVAYRLIVLFVAEDRDVLHPKSASPTVRDYYARYFSTGRLRRLAGRPGTRHTDLWAAHLLVTDALAGDGLALIGVPGLAASLFDRASIGVLDGAQLTNRRLLAAVRELAQIADPGTGVLRPVDYRNLGSEELGGVYEGLLAYAPRYDSGLRTFTVEKAPGAERKRSGCYYTPSELIALVLDEVLDPLIDEARQAPDPEAALLAVTVVDPAGGSGHFVTAASRRIAAALAEVRSDDPVSDENTLRDATADVVARCVFGVDVNALAIEITKISLILEVIDGSRPLRFLDAHFKVGNALLGTTPRLLAANIPDVAFSVLPGDDRGWTAKLKARNKAERARGTDQLALPVPAATTTALSARARALDSQSATTAEQAREHFAAWRQFEADPELTAHRFAADAWCAAFVQIKTRANGPGITHDTLHRILQDPSDVPDSLRRTITSLAGKYQFFHWHLEFPTIFTVPEPGTAQTDPVTGWQGGFSCVVGNPPWERLKIQDKEFFSAQDRADIVAAKTAAIRARMIDRLAVEDPHLFASYLDAQRVSEAAAHLLRDSGRHPLTGRGDVNTYSVFAETFRTITAAKGAAGIITPTGLATDKTTAVFFADNLEAKRLLAFYEFENEGRIFPEVHHSLRFAVTVFSGKEHVAVSSRFAFLNRRLADVHRGRFELTPREVMTMNPNTGTLPMFRSRVDADITLGIYERHPVLVRDGVPDGNPWGLSFCRLFDMATDSHLFHHSDLLTDATSDGWRYRRGSREYVPLYEAKLLGHFDHRFSSYRGATQAQLNVGTLPRPTPAEHDDPRMEPCVRYWVDREDMAERLARCWNRDWLLGWRDIARASDMRTFVPSVLPASAVGHKFPLAFPAEPKHGPLLHAVWSSLVFDYVARQKLSGTGMTYFIVKQLACPTPTTFAAQTPWQPSTSLEQWLRPYVLELSYTSWRLRPYAREMCDNGAPFRWDPDRRALLRADLDAAFLLVYGLGRAEAEHVLDSFPVIRKYEERDHGEFRTRRLVLAAYDRMTGAMTSEAVGWAPPAWIPAGQGARHATSVVADSAGLGALRI